KQMRVGEIKRNSEFRGDDWNQTLGALRLGNTHWHLMATTLFRLIPPARSRLMALSTPALKPFSSTSRDRERLSALPCARRSVKYSENEKAETGDCLFGSSDNLPHSVWRFEVPLHLPETHTDRSVAWQPSPRQDDRKRSKVGGSS